MAFPRCWSVLATALVAGSLAGGPADAQTGSGAPGKKVLYAASADDPAAADGRGPAVGEKPSRPAGKKKTSPPAPAGPAAFQPSCPGPRPAKEKVEAPVRRVSTAPAGEEAQDQAVP